MTFQTPMARPPGLPRNVVLFRVSQVGDEEQTSFRVWATADRARTAGEPVRDEDARRTHRQSPMTSLWLDRPAIAVDAEIGDSYDDVVVGAGLTGLVTALL